MTAQAPLLVVPPNPLAQVPGAINLVAAQLTPDMIVTIATKGSVVAQTTLSNLFAFLFAPLEFPTRQIASLADLPIAAIDSVLLVNLTVPAPITIPLPVPQVGRVLIFKDMPGNWGTNAATFDAGVGKLINGQRTLVANANYETVMLIGMSATQWGTLI